MTCSIKLAMITVYLIRRTAVKSWLHLKKKQKKQNKGGQLRVLGRSLNCKLLIYIASTDIDNSVQSKHKLAVILAFFMLAKILTLASSRQDPLFRYMYWIYLLDIMAHIFWERPPEPRPRLAVMKVYMMNSMYVLSHSSCAVWTYWGQPCLVKSTVTRTPVLVKARSRALKRRSRITSRLRFTFKTNLVFICNLNGRHYKLRA